LSEVDEPYDVVVPYSTWLSAASFVVQVIVAPAEDTAEAVTAEITGGVVSGAAVLNVKSPEFVELLEPSRDVTRKWYVVPAVSPVIVTPCPVTSAVSSVVEEP
jgi:hypothetical protein